MNQKRDCLIKMKSHKAVMTEKSGGQQLGGKSSVTHFINMSYGTEV